MRFIRDILSEARRAARPTVSVEFFPTKTDDGERSLLEKTVPFGGVTGRIAGVAMILVGALSFWLYDPRGT